MFIKFRDHTFNVPLAQNTTIGYRGLLLDRWSHKWRDKYAKDQHLTREDFPADENIWWWEDLNVLVHYDKFVSFISAGRDGKASAYGWEYLNAYDTSKLRSIDLRSLAEKAPLNIAQTLLALSEKRYYEECEAQTRREEAYKAELRARQEAIDADDVFKNPWE